MRTPVVYRFLGERTSAWLSRLACATDHRPNVPQAWFQLPQGTPFWLSNSAVVPIPIRVLVIWPLLAINPRSNKVGEINQ